VGRVSAALAIALVGLACNPKSLRPNYCHSGADCASGNCDLGIRMCVSADASMDGARDGGDGGDGGDADVPFRCKGNDQCGDGGAKVCEPDAGMCVECLRNDDCTGKTMTPICEALMCRACKADSECPDPQICMTDGRCATSTEVIFVEYKSAGCPGENGSSASPYCTPNMAVAQLANGKNVIVVRGPTNNQMNLATTGLKPVIVGRKNSSGTDASILTGAATAITVASDDVFIRDLSVNLGSPDSKGIVLSGAATTLQLVRVDVATGMGLGIQADPGTRLTMDRCRVTNNSKGGIFVDNAMFEIGNTTVSNNGPGDDMGASWGGLRIRTSTAISPKSLQLTTVQNNNQVGVSCSFGVSGTGVLVSGSSGGVEISPSCGFSSCGPPATTTCGSQQ